MLPVEAPPWTPIFILVRKDRFDRTRVCVLAPHPKARLDLMREMKARISSLWEGWAGERAGDVLAGRAQATAE